MKKQQLSREEAIELIKWYDNNVSLEVEVKRHCSPEMLYASDNDCIKHETLMAVKRIERINVVKMWLIDLFDIREEDLK